MATATITRQEEILTTLVTELANGVDEAVECWMAQVDHILQNPRLPAAAKLAAISEVLERYKLLTGKQELHGRAM